MNSNCNITNSFTPLHCMLKNNSTTSTDFKMKLQIKTSLNASIQGLVLHSIYYNLSICHLFPLLQVSASTEYSRSIALQDDSSDLRVMSHQLNPILHLHNIRHRTKLDLSLYMYIIKGRGKGRKITADCSQMSAGIHGYGNTVEPRYSSHTWDLQN